MRFFFPGYKSLLLLATLQTTSCFANDFSHIPTPPILPHSSAITPRQTLISGFHWVPEEKVALVEYMGNCHTIDKPGFHRHIPLLTSIFMIDLRTILVDTPPQIATTKDFHSLSIDGAFSYRVTNPYNAVYKIQNLENTLTFLYFQSILSHIAQMTNAETMLLDKGKFSKTIKDAINSQIKGTTDSDEEMDGPSKTLLAKSQKTSIQAIKQDAHSLQKDIHDQSWGVIVENVSITNIAYPKSVIRTMNQQRDAEAQKKILETQADAEKTKIILAAEANLIAITKEAEAQAKKREIENKTRFEAADTEAKSLITLAKAEAEALKIKTEAEIEAMNRRTEAEAKKKSMFSEIYTNSPSLVKREQMMDVVDAVTKLHTSHNSKVIISNGDKDNNNFITQLFAMQSMVNGSNPEDKHFNSSPQKMLQGS